MDATSSDSALPRSYEKLYREMMLGGGHINQNQQQFMENDRKAGADGRRAQSHP